MIEYIEREVIKKMLENAQIISDGEYSGYCTEDINVDVIPAEDVSSVVHGRWVLESDDDQDEGHYYCSICKSAEYFADFVPFSKFCSNCGAKMQEAR